MLRGQLFLPGSASPVSVEITATIDGLRLTGGSVDLAVAFAVMSTPSAAFVSAGTIQLEWEGHALSVSGADPVARLRALLPPELAKATGAADASARRSMRVSWAVVLGFVVGIPLALLLFKDPIVDVAVHVVPTRVDRELGDLIHGQLGPGMLKDGAAVEGVRAIGARLLAAAPEHPYQFRFEVKEDASVNAFAAPGGVVVVHTGLIRTASSADELAGVLSHELTHVLHRHTMRQLVFKLGFVGTISLMVGSGEGVGEVIAMMALGLSDLGFSRDQERDADESGLRLLRAAKLSPDGLVTFFGKLGGNGAIPAILSTHPASEDRIEHLRRTIAAEGTWPVEPLTVDWAAMKASVTR